METSKFDDFDSAQKSKISDIGESFSKETVNDLDNAREIENVKKIEAALFLSARWLSMQELITLTDVNPILLRQLMGKLRENYGENSAINILEKENSWKMDVKPEHVNMINKLATGSAEFTKSEQETLAVIAYKQPIKQSVIIKIRGNKAYEHIKNFISLGLVKAKKQGHTQELSLSEEFHDYFHVGKNEFGGGVEESKVSKEEKDENIGKELLNNKEKEENESQQDTGDKVS